MSPSLTPLTAFKMFETFRLAFPETAEPTYAHVSYGASHGIGHQLGPFGVGHGHTSCVLLPAVMKYNAKRHVKKQEVLQEVMWHEVGDILVMAGLRKESSDTGDALRAIFDELGMLRSLRDVGVGKEDWGQIAVNSLTGPLMQYNARLMNRKEQVMEVLKTILESVLAECRRRDPESSTSLPRLICSPGRYANQPCKKTW